MTTIVFRCPSAGMEKMNDSEVHFAMQIIKRLKERGVPVIGYISIRGVEYGKLTMESIGSELVFTWVPGPKPVAAKPISNFDDEEL